MLTISHLFTSKCQHGQYRALKVEYLLPMQAFTKISVLYNFRNKKLSKLCTQLRDKQLVPYLPVNASMDNIPYCSYRHTCATPVVHSHNYEPHTTLG